MYNKHVDNAILKKKLLLKNYKYIPKLHCVEWLYKFCANYLTKLYSVEMSYLTQALARQDPSLSKKDDIEEKMAILTVMLIVMYHNDASKPARYETYTPLELAKRGLHEFFRHESKPVLCIIVTLRAR